MTFVRISRRHVWMGGAAALLPLSGFAQTSHVDKKPSLAPGREPAVASKNADADPRVAGLCAKVVETNLVADLEAMAGFGTRLSSSSKANDARDWLVKRFSEAGYPPPDTWTQEFALNSATKRHNVLCGSKDSSILLGAHYDSISEQPQTLAPGADDNGTGVAVLLEAARILRDAGLRKKILFAGFCGEEQGTIGSAACAKVAQHENWPLELMYNLDMVGFAAPAAPAITSIEYDQGNVVTTNDVPSRAVGMLIAQAAADFTDLTFDHTDIWSSDYMPFEAIGVPCVGLYDNGGDSPRYHHSTDTLEGIDPHRLGQVARLVVASLAIISGFEN